MGQHFARGVVHDQGGDGDFLAEALRVAPRDLLRGLLQPAVDGGLDAGRVRVRRDQPVGKMRGKRRKFAPAVRRLRDRGVASACVIACAAAARLMTRLRASTSAA